MSTLAAKFTTHWQKKFAHLFMPASRVLVTVSGGVDSVVLLDLAIKSGLNITIAHVNFGLRGDESHRDENFVRELAGKYQVELLVKNFPTREYAETNKLSIQEAARVLRYQWFAEILKNWRESNNAPNYILTAHHADDNIETVMMHFFRGTGLWGLTGIQSVKKEQSLLRPLLPFHKKELQRYAVENDLKFVEDSSNASDKYTRNFFRNQLLPAVKEVFPQTEENLTQNINRLAEANILYRQAIDQQLKKLLVTRGNEVHIPVLKWKKTEPLHTLTWEIIKPYGFNAQQAEDVIKLLDGDNGTYISSATYRIIRNRQWMIIATNATEQAGHIVIEGTENHLVFPNGELEISHKDQPAKMVTDPLIALLDADKVSFPIILRPWKQGDYFYPLGMKKKKKLSRFFIDNKLSRTEKEKTWVLESDKKIIWVLGQRIDDRYKLNPNTKKVLSFHYLK